MFVRIWHGWTTPENADAYEQLLNATIVPSIMSREISGLNSVDVLRRADGTGTEVEFVTSMRFDDWTAVETFAGPDPTGSVVPAAARQVLERYDEHSQHYEVVARHVGDR